MDIFEKIVIEQQNKTLCSLVKSAIAFDFLSASKRDYFDK